MLFTNISVKLKNIVKMGGFLMALTIPCAGWASSVIGGGTSIGGGSTSGELSDITTCNTSSSSVCSGKNGGYACPNGDYKCPSGYTLSGTRCSRSSSSTGSDSTGSYTTTYTTPCDASPCLEWSSTEKFSGGISQCSACLSVSQ